MQSVTRKVVLAQLRARTARVACRAVATEAQGSYTQPDRSGVYWAAAAASALGMATAMSLHQQERPAAMEKAYKISETDQIRSSNQPPPRPDLPTYTMEEVAEHADEDSLWYTFR